VIDCIDCLQLSDNRDASSELFVDHESEGSHHGGTSVVEFNGTLGKLGLLVEVVPSKVEGSVAEVTDELVSGSSNVLHDTELEDANKGNHLGKAKSGDGVGALDGGPSVGEGVETVSGLIDGSGKVDTVSGGDLSEEGKHTYASVLDLDKSEAVELFLVTVFNESQRIEVSERLLGTEGVLKGRQFGGGHALLGGSESSGGGDEGGKDGRLHCELFLYFWFSKIVNYVKDHGISIFGTPMDGRRKRESCKFRELFYHHEKADAMPKIVQMGEGKTETLKLKIPRVIR